MSKERVLECPPKGCYHSPRTRRVEGESPTPQGSFKTSPQDATAGAGVNTLSPLSDGLLAQHKVLYLNLTRGWFNLIRQGIKKTEFREFKPYYHKRFLRGDGGFKRYDIAHLQNGYSKNSPSFYIRIKSINIVNHICWGRTYAIQLGEIIPPEIGYYNCPPPPGVF